MFFEDEEITENYFKSLIETAKEKVTIEEETPLITIEEMQDWSMDDYEEKLRVYLHNFNQLTLISLALFKKVLEAKESQDEITKTSEFRNALECLETGQMHGEEGHVFLFRISMSCINAIEAKLNKVPLPETEPIWKIGDKVAALNGEPRIITGMSWNYCMANMYQRQSKMPWVWFVDTVHPELEKEIGCGWEGSYKART